LSNWPAVEMLMKIYFIRKRDFEFVINIEVVKGVTLLYLILYKTQVSSSFTQPAGVTTML
jgi:hypothetical protein